MKKQIFTLGPNGLEELKPRPALAVGTRIFAYGFAMRCEIYGLISEDGQAVAMLNRTDTTAESYAKDSEGVAPFIKIDEFTRPVSQKFGIGYYYDDTPNARKFTPEELAEAVKFAEEVKAAQECEKVDEARRAALLRSALLEKYGNFLTVNPTTAREISGNLKKELKNAFPGVRFSVRYSSFSGGDSLTVKYTDGPTLDKVRTIVDKYQDSHADYTGDFWDYDPSEFNRLFGGAKYVTTDREFSAERMAAAREKVAADFPELSGDMRAEDFTEQLYKLDTDDPRREWLGIIGRAYWVSPATLARLYLTPQDLSPTTEKQTAAAVEVKQLPEGLEVVEYSPKSFAVIGNTRPLAATLKELGGRFNARLSCGAGWIFPASKRAAVVDTLNIL